MIPGAFLATGGSSGIGAAIVGELSLFGRRVGVISRACVPKARQACGESVQQIDWIEADLLNESVTSASVAAWLARIDQPLDGVVLSAVDYGLSPRHDILSSTLAECDQLWAINLRSQFALISRLLPTLLARPRAVILVISSVAALEAAPGRALYAATKAASLALFRSLAEELADTGISVIQALPQNQVQTPGLWERRPEGFTFDGYDAPEIFEPLTAHIHSTLGAGMNGAILSVDSHGGWLDRRTQHVGGPRLS